MNTEVFALFQKYRDLLNGEVRNPAQARWIGAQCERIENRLYRRGCQTCSRVRMEFKKCEATGKITEIIRYFELFLVMLPPNNQTPVPVAYATNTQFPLNIPHENSFEALLERVDQEKQEEAEASVSVWRRTWEFSEKEGHALLAAVERHWKIIETESRLSEEEMVLPSREMVFWMINGTRALAPAGMADIYIFSALLDKELEYLTAADANTELAECGCRVEEHLRALEDWEMRNLL